MADLSVKLYDMILKHPVMTAAGPSVKDAEAAARCLKGGASLIVTKTISSIAAKVPRPCMEEIPQGMLNTELWSELSPERWFSFEYEKIKDLGLPVIISLGYTKEQLSQIVKRAAPFADAFEISTHYVGKDIKPVIEALHEAKKGGIPVFMKISPGIDNVSSFARKLEEEGADGFVAINSLGPSMRIDIKSGLPFMGSKKGYGWLSGKAIFPLALRHVYEIASSVNVPVIGVGGISCGRDALEMIMAGATAVQVCTEAILKGPSIYGKIAFEMNKLMEEEGFKDLDSIRGITIKRLKKREFRTYSVFPRVNNKCTLCKKCQYSCPYEAIKVKQKVEIDEDKCFGCGLCVSRCQVGALNITRGE